MSWTCIFCLAPTKMSPTDFSAKDVGNLYPKEAKRLQRVDSHFHLGPYCNSEACIDRALDKLKAWAEKLKPSRDEHVAIVAYAIVRTKKSAEAS
jgi:hypothetical protein